MKRAGNLYVAVAVAVVLGLLASAGAAFAASKDEESRFLAEARRVTQKKDLPGLMALVCWDQADAKAKKMVEGHLKNVLKEPVKDVTLEDASDFPFKTNLKVTKKLSFVISENQRSSIPVGEKAGKLMVAVTVE